MPNLYISGEEVPTGSHGDHDYVYASGEAVPDTGVSTFVFETGTGVGGGGDIQYAWDGGSLQPASPVVTNETASEFYGYGEDYTDSGNHGYWDGNDTVTFLVHEDGRDGTRTLIATFARPEDGVSGSHTTNFDPSMPSSPSISELYAVQDGTAGTNEQNDSYNYGDTFHTWNNATDGWGISNAYWTDHTITWSDLGWASDVRFITSDGPTPDGGSADYYGGIPSSLRVVLE